ncbi:NUDIX domain-containing protein [Microbacterium sp. SMR1]|uniref:NUDIX domain-containing protein n=1 Tax=Microbacterium sp. SMR1 TaxID=1497340 RepID=UPI000DCBC633|nr:NUDIX domain-containing protein [Microbacterium sp. SMR1]RAZ31787.1 NTP pyrophosphohydrolase [Microbacterium sp. SMR1]
MTDDPAAAPRPPHGPRDPGDAWVVAPSGERYWGRFGAAGLLAIDPEWGVLLQHRVSWSHFGDTWGLPGGARHAGESARDGALRESAEEAGVPADAVAPRFLSVLDVGVWTYGTLVADVTTPFHPVISDPESRELAWVPIDEVESFPLHPGFAASWPRLRGLLSLRPTVIVDVANVVGSVPDGWWRDRAGAAERLLAQVAALAERGMDAADLELPEDIWFPRVVAVVEGQARDVTAPAGVELARAPAAGDDAIVEATTAAVAAGERVSVVTSDRELRARVEAVGARAVSTSWLRDRL